MAGKSPYTDETRARVYVTLKANEENVKRTARDTGVPENTVRRWRDEWRNGINVPTAENVKAESDAFIGDAERVRGLALAEIERKIAAGEAKVSELNAVVGTLDDKITRARGIDRDRNLHVHHHLPPKEELAELLTGFIDAQVAMAERNDEIIEGKLVEELPQST